MEVRHVSNYTSAVLRLDLSDEGLTPLMSDLE